MIDDIIHTFLHPKSVAVIGASKNLVKGGYRIVSNLVLNNFKGKVYLVNPNAEGELYKLRFYKSVLDIEEEVEIAIFYVPNHTIPGLLKECIQKGVKGAIIEASGFEEVGVKGLELKRQILEITNNFSRIRIVGPNCMGLSTIDEDSDSEQKSGFFSGFGVFTKYRRGNIAIISQSGMLNGGYLMHQIDLHPEMGLRYSCSIGNKMDLGEIEFMQYLIKDPTVNVIAIYLESFKNPRQFIELCKRVRDLPDKTIILVKGGLTSLGQKATLSHTGSLAENANLVNAIIKQSHIIQANNFYELFQYAQTFSMMYNSRKKLPKKGNVAFVAGSGGAGTITADLTMKYGLKFPEFSEDTYKILLNVFPDWMPPNHFAFVDIWPAMEKAMMNRIRPDIITKKVYDALIYDPQIEGIFNMMFCSRQFRAMSNFEEMAKSFQSTEKPIYFWLIGETKEVANNSKILGAYNIPNFPSLEDMVKNFKILVQESKNKDK
ncbi:MAG: CoA-binding protein [Candidatus Thorarchaeota archaeon]